LGKPGGEPQDLVKHASVEDDAIGAELQVFWKLEPGPTVLEKVALPEPGGLDDPERLDAFLDAVRRGAVSSADIQNVQAPFRLGIDIEDRKLDRVVRGIRMPRVNLLIADHMRLGKTIEAEPEDPEFQLRGDRGCCQLRFFSQAESEQCERNRNALRAGFRAIPTNIRCETAANRARFADPRPRKFPVAVTFLAPRGTARGS
jgi:hypothetical protein